MRLTLFGRVKLDCATRGHCAVDLVLICNRLSLRPVKAIAEG